MMSLLTFIYRLWLRIFIFFTYFHRNKIWENIFNIIYFVSISYFYTLDIVDRNLMISFRFKMSHIFSRIMIHFFLDIFCYYGNIIFFISFIFRGVLSLEPIGLPCFNRIWESHVSSAFSRSYGILIRAVAFAAGICDLITALVSKRHHVVDFLYSINAEFSEHLVLIVL